MEILFKWPTDADGWVLFLSLWVIVILFNAIMFLIALYVYDTNDLEETKGSGQVIGKKFTGSHYELILLENAALNRSDYINVNRPEVYKILVEVGDSYDWIEVSESVYDRIKRLQMVPVTYSISRFFKTLIIYSINL